MGNYFRNWCDYSASYKRHPHWNIAKHLSASRMELERKMRYPIVIHKDVASDFGVTIPDLPGCFSAGATMEEAINMALEAAECHIEGLLTDSELIPTPSAIEIHRNNPAYEDGVWDLIEIDISKLSLKSKRINITMPERLIRTVDQYAKRHGTSRSGLLARAVTEYMASRHL